MIEHAVSVARHVHGADYVELAGLPRLREAFAAELCHTYRGQVHGDHVLVTAGCNQAFCLVISALAEPGGEVILALPYYFNHDMWLRLNGIVPTYLEPGQDLVPTAEAAEALIGPRTRAIILVSPGNPSGVTIDPGGIAAFAEVARRPSGAGILNECSGSTSTTTTSIGRIGRWGCDHPTRPPLYSSSAPISTAAFIDATCSAGSSMSTNKLHE